MGPPLISNLVLWTCLKKGGGALAECTGKFLKFESRKWHLQHSENTFCKNVMFFKKIVFKKVLESFRRVLKSKNSLKKLNF
jgi:hypothetical protein